MDPTIIVSLVDRNKRLPMYMQLAQSLEEMIRSGKLQPGDVLPTEAELCEALLVSAVTVKKGLGVLVKKELIRRIPGRGSFVAERVQRVQSSAAEKADASSGGDFAVLMTSESGEEFRLSDSWHSRIAEGFEMAVSRTNGNVRYLPWPGEKASENDPAWDALRGVVVFDQVPDPARYRPVCLALARRKIPAVCVSYCWCPEEHDNVCFDQSKVGHVAAMHLVTAGYNRFIIARESGVDQWGERRLQGFLTGLEVAGASHAARRVIELPFLGDWLDLGRQIAEKIVQAGGRAFSAGAAGGGASIRTAIVAGNDQIAAGIAQFLGQRGLVSGRDYGLIGCGEDPVSRRLELSTIGFPLAKAGELAAMRLLGLLEKEPGTFRYSLWPYVIRRRSTVLPE